MTVDFFTPIVDDPYEFGAIAAANSLSDVYAMGGRPLAALNVCCFPPKEDKDLLRSILQGGADKLREAGAVLAGGHSVRDDDLKYGMAVIGIAPPGEVLTNGGARPGDKLILTKPIGTGLLSTARKKNAIEEDDFRVAVENMLELNKAGAEAMKGLEVSACTDVTGFGLLGHGREMAAASGVCLAIELALVPLLEKSRWCAEKGHSPGGAKSNLKEFGASLIGKPKRDEWYSILPDPQTSGGLLIAVGASDAEKLTARLEDLGVRGGCIGEVLDGPAGGIKIIDE